MIKLKFLALSLLMAAAFSYSAFSTERPIVRDLSAASSGGTTITLSWELPDSPAPAITGLLVYRSTKPVASYYDISDSEPVAKLSGETFFFSDSVNDFKDYYYAVIARTDSGLYDIVLPSINATVNGAHLKIPQKTDTEEEKTASAKETIYSSDGMRTTPLPFLDFVERQNSSVKLSDEMYLIARRLGKSYSAPENRINEPYIFEEDLISPDGGDGFLLFEVLRTTFIQKKYQESAAELERLIRTNRTQSVTARATFYLAESYYFSGDYKNAAKTFLKVYDTYPAAAKRWIDSSLDLYELLEE